ncbi:hypothetical protein H1C71_008713, partial [Ictidomys tridecemlineatus]|uniref:G-protein coupled receptors family 1 profile domain-containing protein n=1 Tax=Ictidomys tridecemlineatus TaxID=43179 RepID=A0A287D3G0_ICTTR
MDKHNLTTLKEFILMGITDLFELQAPLFVLFLLVYMISVVDLGYSIAVGPKMLVNVFEKQSTISYSCCAAQLTFFSVFNSNTIVIVYDHYVAIYDLLLYTVIMSQASGKTLALQHFYCDSLPLISLLCSDTHGIRLILLMFSSFKFVSSLLIVLVSCILILVTILRKNSAEGRYKTFSTCGSPLTVIVPKTYHSFDTGKMASVFYILVTPMLNPMIYCFRNKEVKNALQRTWKMLVHVFF